MSRIQEEAPQTASRRPSPARAVAPRRSKASHRANVSVTKANRSVSTTTKARSKKATDASSNDQKQWHIDLLRMWLEPRTAAFCITIFVSLVIGIINFAKTGSISLFYWLTSYVAAFSGVQDIARLKDIFRR